MSTRDDSSLSTEPTELATARTTTLPQRPSKLPRPTVRTALRDLERTQFDALESSLRDLDR